MGQSQRACAEVADTVITNALIVDYQHRQSRCGIKHGRISGIGRAIRMQPNVDIIIGPGTEIIAGEGNILTAGGVDSHIHFICPQQIEEALASGVTIMIGGGTGPVAGTSATTCTPVSAHARMLQAADLFPMNLGFWQRQCEFACCAEEQIEAGAMGPKIA